MTADTDLQDLKAVLIANFPELSDSHFTLLPMGWHSAAVDVDDRLIFKFPRHEMAEKALRMEAALLRTIRPAVTITVPDLTLHAGPPLFSRHAKIKGEHLVTEQYEKLPPEARQRLAADMALFFAELHRLDMREMEIAGATSIVPWLPPERILANALPVLSPSLRTFAERTVVDWQSLESDPYGITYGFFDGHGWNMAFDHERQRLNGIYDFADSGFAPLHQEFVYPNLIARDLTERIVGEYEKLTGRLLDRKRIETLTGVFRLSELAEYATDAEHAPLMLHHLAQWAGTR